MSDTLTARERALLARVDALEVENTHLRNRPTTINKTTVVEDDTWTGSTVGDIAVAGAAGLVGMALIF